MNKFLITFSTAVILSLFLITTSQATIMVGGYRFDDKAFADSLISSTVNWTYSGRAPSIEIALVGINPNDFTYNFTTGANVVLGFTDNRSIFRAGYDLAVSELESSEIFALAVEIGSTTNSYNVVSTAPTPEPTTILLFGIGIGLLGLAGVSKKALPISISKHPS